MKALFHTTITILAAPLAIAALFAWDSYLWHVDAQVLTRFTGATSSQPLALSADDSLLLVANPGNNTVSLFDLKNGGARVAEIAVGKEPNGVALSPDGSLYIADTGNHRVRKVDHGGTITTVAGDGTPAYRGDGGPGVNASLNAPAGLAFDLVGNLYIADTGNNRIRKIARDGTITTVGGDGTAEQLLEPSALVFSGDGVLYIADTGNHRIRTLAVQAR